MGHSINNNGVTVCIKECGLLMRFQSHLGGTRITTEHSRFTMGESWKGLEEFMAKQQTDQGSNRQLHFTGQERGTSLPCFCTRGMKIVNGGFEKLDVQETGTTLVFFKELQNPFLYGRVNRLAKDITLIKPSDAAVDIRVQIMELEMYKWTWEWMRDGDQEKQEPRPIFINDSSQLCCLQV